MGNIRKKRSNRFKQEPIPLPTKKKIIARILPLLNLQKRHRTLAVDICFNLFTAKLADRTIADGRRTNEQRQRAKIWDKLEKEDLCHACIGNQISKKVTRYIATPKLMKLLHDANHVVPKESCLVANSSLPAKKQNEYALMIIKSPKKMQTVRK